MKSCELVIIVYSNYAELNSSCELSNFYSSDHGDLRFSDELKQVSYPCMRNFRKNGRYFKCSGIMKFSGKLISNGLNSTEFAVFQSNPQPLPTKGGVCVNGSNELIFEVFDEKTVLLTAKTKSDFLVLKINQNTYNLSISDGEGSQYLIIKNNEILGTTLKFKTKNEESSCIVGIAKNTNVSYDYTQIKYPIWLIVIITIVKVLSAIYFIIKRCLKSKNLKQPNYQEIELAKI